MENIDKILADNVRQIRKKLGMTQEELAEKAGLATMSIQRVERRERWPGLNTIDKIALALGCQSGELFQCETASKSYSNEAVIGAMLEMERELASLRAQSKNDSPELLRLIKSVPPELVEDAELYLSTYIELLEKKAKLKKS